MSTVRARSVPAVLPMGLSLYLAICNLPLIEDVQSSRTVFKKRFSQTTCRLRSNEVMDSASMLEYLGVGFRLKHSNKRKTSVLVVEVHPFGKPTQRTQNSQMKKRRTAATCAHNVPYPTTNLAQSSTVSICTEHAHKVLRGHATALQHFTPRQRKDLLVGTLESHVVNIHLGKTSRFLVKKTSNLDAAGISHAHKFTSAKHSSTKSAAQSTRQETSKAVSSPYADLAQSLD